MSRLLHAPRSILDRIAKPGSIEPEEPVLLEDVSWETYEEFTDQLHRSGRRLRVTYDEGRLEIMTLSSDHEQRKTLLARLIEIYAIVRDVPVTGSGSTTLRIPKHKGLEPDESYYVQTPPPPPSVGLLDLKKYPPPDLGIEVDISNSSIPRQPVYAFIGVPEVWRFDGQRVVFLLRKRDGTYRTASRSRALPEITSAVINRFLSMSDEASQHDVVVAFRAWLNEP